MKSESRNDISTFNVEFKENCIVLKVNELVTHRNTYVYTYNFMYMKKGKVNFRLADIITLYLLIN